MEAQQGITRMPELELPPPATVDDAAARAEQGYDCTDWYFCKKQL